MEAALEALRSVSETDQAKNALSLMQVYVNNIVKDPANPKYRKIRISNPKFNTAIWQLEQARTFLLFSGFEQEGDFLVLPSSIKLDGAKLLIDEALGISPSNQTSHASTSAPSNTSQPSSMLKLNAAKDCSLFDQDVKADLTLLSYMKEMGYDVAVAENALIATKNKGIQPAIDWINQNPDKAREKLQQSGTNVASDVLHGNTQGISQQSLASSSSPSPAPVQSRYQKTLDERHKFQERLRLEAIEEAKLEKQRKKLHKENLLKDMKDEKDEKLEKAKQAKLAEDAAEPSNKAITDQQCGDGESPMVDLRIRMPDGQVLSLSLSSNSTIQTLYQEVKNQLPSNDSQSLDDFVLMTSFPQRRISDMESTLEAAGLAPRAALVVQRTDQQGVLTQGEGPVYSVRNVTKMDNWQELLSEQDKLIVVQFYAPWCSLCRSVSDSYDSLNASYGMNGQVLFARVNVDELKVLKYQQRVTSLPTFKLFWNEKVIADVEGTDMEGLKQQIEANVNGPTDVDQPDESSMDEMFHDPR
ncbi:uncharacterized protein LOC144657354 [Oculina patagonica]